MMVDPIKHGAMANALRRSGAETRDEWDVSSLKQLEQ